MELYTVSFKYVAAKGQIRNAQVAVEAADETRARVEALKLLSDSSVRFPSITKISRYATQLDLPVETDQKPAKGR